MIPSNFIDGMWAGTVYQRGLVIDSQLGDLEEAVPVSISKGIGD